MQASDITFEAALARAYENRPDIQSIALKKDALEKTVDLNKKDYLPILSGNAAYGYAGQDSSLNQSWNVGVAVTFPFFSGFSTKYAVEEARAGLDIAKANEETLRQKVFQEVKSAWLNRHEAFERIEAGKITVRQAEESLELAQGRYATGVGNSIEITDAMIKLNNAKMTYIAALSDFNIAEASLEKAMGAKTP
jgi:outer membrane protein TolC